MAQHLAEQALLEQLRRIRDFSRNVGDILPTVADILEPRSFDELVEYGFQE